MSDKTKIPDPNKPNGIPEPHEYDGIHEEHNDLPRWWLYLFYLCIVFAAGYFGYYQLGPGLSLRTEFDKTLAEFRAKHPNASSDETLSDEAFAKLASAPGTLSEGKALFDLRCVVCHGAKGQGLIGPNLTDNFWIHGTGKNSDVATVIRDGVPPKGMPPWGSILSKTDIAKVTLYVHSLKGTHPEGAKPPQGEEHKE